VLVVGLLITVGIAVTGRNDLDIYLAASNDLLAGVDMYAKLYFEGFSYFYSPLFALLVAPLGVLGPVVSKLVWSGLMLAALWRSWWLADRMLLVEASSRVKLAVGFVTLLVLFQAARDNLNSSQVTFFVIWSMLEGVYRIQLGGYVMGALVIAVGIDMKLLPLVLLPYLAYRRWWLPLVLVIACVLVLQVPPAVVSGWEGMHGLLRSRWALIDPSDTRHILDEDEPSTIALGSLLSAYLSTEGGNQHTLSLPRNLANLDLGQFKLLLLAGRLLLVLLALYFLRWPPFRPARDNAHAWWELSYLMLCTVLLFPHQRNYSLMLAGPAVAWLAWHAIAGPGRHVPRTGWWWTPRIALLLGFNASMLAGNYAPIYDHYKLYSFLTIGTILMLMACGPGEMWSSRRPARTGLLQDVDAPHRWE